MAVIPIGMPGMGGMPMNMNGMGGIPGMGMPGGFPFPGSGMLQGMNGMPGMIPAGFPGMPFGMINPHAQQPKK